MGYSFRLTASDILGAISHRQDNTYHGLYYTSRGALAGTRNSSSRHERTLLPRSYISLLMTQNQDCHQRLLMDDRSVHITSCGALDGRKEGNVLFNDALNTFYLRLYGVTHMVKDHSDSERGNPLPPHGLLISIISKGSFICTITQTGSHIPRPLLHQSWSTGCNKKNSSITPP